MSANRAAVGTTRRSVMAPVDASGSGFARPVLGLLVLVAASCGACASRPSQAPSPAVVAPGVVQDSPTDRLRDRCALDMDRCDELLLRDVSLDALELECTRNPAACLELAFRTTNVVQRVRDDTFDFERAMRAVAQGCALEHVPSCSLWAVLTLDTATTAADQDKAAATLRSACDSQYWPACAEVANRQLVDAAEGAVLVRQACDGGYGLACYNTAVDLRGPQVDAKRRRLLGKGCAADHAASCIELSIHEPDLGDARDAAQRGCEIAGTTDVCRHYGNYQSHNNDCATVRQQCDSGHDWACAAFSMCDDDHARRRDRVEHGRRCLRDDDQSACIDSFVAYAGGRDLSDTGDPVPFVVAPNEALAARLVRHGCILAATDPTSADFVPFYAQFSGCEEPVYESPASAEPL